MKDIEELKKRALSEIKKTDSLEKAKVLKKKYLGKDGEVSKIRKSTIDKLRKKISVQKNDDSNLKGTSSGGLLFRGVTDFNR